MLEMEGLRKEENRIRSRSMRSRRKRRSRRN
jgi:hypothetical protein